MCIYDITIGISPWNYIANRYLATCGKTDHCSQKYDDDHKICDHHDNEYENEDKFLLFYIIFFSIIILNSITPWKALIRKMSISLRLQQMLREGPPEDRPNLYRTGRR